MSVNYKVLGQSAPSATTLTTLYTVPASTQSVISTIVAANRSATPTDIRIAIRPAGAGIADEHYIAHTVPIAANEVLTFTIGVTLEATDVISVYNTLATVSFNAFGSEIS